MYICNVTKKGMLITNKNARKIALWAVMLMGIVVIVSSCGSAKHSTTKKPGGCNCGF
jgi:hypothetical protein